MNILTLSHLKDLKHIAESDSLLTCNKALHHQKTLHNMWALSISPKALKCITAKNLLECI